MLVAPERLRPGQDRIRDLALVAAFEAGARGTLLSVWPLVMIRAFREGTTVSAIYLCVGVLSLSAGLMVPWLSQRLPRSRLMVLAGGLYVTGAALALTGAPLLAALGLLTNAVATVTFWVCLSAYVLDHVPREDLGRNESTRMLYSATAWMAGPFAGVILLDLWRPAPFLVSAAFGVAMVLRFRSLRLGDGRRMARPASGLIATPAPLAYLGRFVRRPRLVAGFLFAAIRSSGWWVYVVYLPLYCIGAGLDDAVGGAALSLSNGLLFATPLMLRLVGILGVRNAVRGTFAWCAVLFSLATLLAGFPWAVVACLALGSVGLVMLDVCGSLPFLMAVKPSERTEMAAVHSSFRDVSGIATPAVAGLILLVAPVAGVFIACGAAMAGACALAGRLHPRLGRTRSVRT